MQVTVNIEEIMPSKLAFVGLYPAFLSLLAVVAGLAALVMGKRKFIPLFALVLACIACAGLGESLWRLAKSGSSLSPTAGIEPAAWHYEVAHACAAGGAVLPACALGFLLLAIVWLKARDALSSDPSA